VKAIWLPVWLLAARLLALDVPVTDDVEVWPDGAVKTESSDLELADDLDGSNTVHQTIQLRFAPARIPVATAVTNAYLRFTAKDATAGPCALVIRGLNATVSWSPAPWAAGQEYTSPNVASLVTELLQAGKELSFTITGKGTRRAWSLEGNASGAPVLVVEWAGEAAVSPAPVGAVEPVTGHTDATVNEWIDRLQAGGLRLLELPLIELVTGLVVAGMVVLAVLFFLRRRRWLFWTAAALVVLSVTALIAFVVDQKVIKLTVEMRELRSRTGTDAIGLLDVLTGRGVKRKTYLGDMEAAERRLRGAFGAVRCWPVVYDEATDVVFLRLTAPLTQVYLAIVDLENPAVRIRIGPPGKAKRLTSLFAREQDCAVAINGEAGVSPGANSGFGHWIGNLVIEGRTVLLEDTDQRPFLSFDRWNRAAYWPAQLVDRQMSPDRFNVIWGRWDVLRDGAVVGAKDSNRQPRTAMAINRDGTRLFLMVVDGRQPGYSGGLSAAEAGLVLQAFGAHAGMLCDEGGSSCLYLKKLGGIANIPSDDRGRERPTYTHFGVSVGKR
jgi:hypothetical protein